MTRPPYNPRLLAPAYVPAAPATAEPQIGTGAKLGFAVICIYTLLLYSRAVEFIDSHGTLHLMILTGVPAVFLCVMSGGAFRALGTRIGLYLAFFTGWIVLGLPFSIWRGGSVYSFLGGWAKSFIIFLLVAGLISSFRQLRQFAFVIAWSAAIMLLVVNLHALRGADDRFSAQWGTLGNSNDLATQLLLGIPFCIYVVSDKRRPILLRIWFALISVASVLTALRTGSRGALIAIVLLGAVVFFKASATIKIGIVAAFLALLGSLPFLLTPELKARYMTILQSGDSAQAAMAVNDMNVRSALLSTEARRAMLEHALNMSIHHPVFGVGYAEFPVADANRAWASGEIAYWHEVHNVFAVIMVENGIPALILFGCALYTAFRLAARDYNRTRKDPSQKEMARFSLCLLTALTVYFVCNNFATDAYGFQFPLLGGIAAALEIHSRSRTIMQVPVRTPLFPLPSVRPVRSRRLSPQPIGGRVS